MKLNTIYSVVALLLIIGLIFYSVVMYYDNIDTDSNNRSTSDKGWIYFYLSMFIVCIIITAYYSRLPAWLPNGRLHNIVRSSI